MLPCTHAPSGPCMALVVLESADTDRFFTCTVEMTCAFVCQQLLYQCGRRQESEHVLLSHCLPQQVGGGVWVNARLRHGWIVLGPRVKTTAAAGLCVASSSSAAAAHLLQSGSRLRTFLSFFLSTAGFSNLSSKSGCGG